MEGKYFNMLDAVKKARFLIVLSILFMSKASVSANDLFSKMIVIKPNVRVEAPSFTLHDINGTEKKLEDFKGKVILLNFWATWCFSCREEMPHMERLWKKFSKDDFVIIAIAVDRGNKRKVLEFCNEIGVTFPILLDPKGRVRNNYEVTALPMSYIIGKDGKIEGKVIGARKWNGSNSIKLFEKLLH